MKGALINRHDLLLVAAMILLLSGGCSSNAGPGTKRDRQYLLEIKTMVLGFQRNVEKNPVVTKGQLPVVIENLEESKYEELGEHQAKVEKLTSLAKQLEALYKTSASPPGAAKIIEEMADLANSLPGSPDQGDASRSSSSDR